MARKRAATDDSQAAPATAEGDKAATSGGTATMKTKGLRPVMFYVTPAEHVQLKTAASASGGQPLSHFVRGAALERAEKILGKIAKRG